jgi:hypothetical protein
MKTTPVIIMVAIMCATCAPPLFAEDFDRDSCINYCRDTYLTPGLNDGRGTSPYAQCMASCESRFWADFDKRARSLEERATETDRKW